MATERKTIMENIISGKIKHIGAIEDIGANGFQKRDVWIVTDEQYPQTVALQFDGSHINKPDQCTVGEEVSISFNCKGREWTNDQGVTKVFNTLQGWKISKSGNAAAPTPTAAQQQTAAPAANNPAPSAAFTADEDDDDLLF